MIDQRLFQFTLVEIGNWVDSDQSTGRIIHIPNGWVFKQTTANYTAGFKFIWDEIPVMVTFESNWQRAKGIMLGIAQRHTVIKDEDAAEDAVDFAYPTSRFYHNAAEGKPGAGGPPHTQ